jgi:hypothetical protein
LAQVALRDNYVKPQFTDSDTFEIVEGRHPMGEVRSLDPLSTYLLDEQSKHCDLTHSSQILSRFLSRVEAK